MKRKYYSARVGHTSIIKLDLKKTLRLFASAYNSLETRCYFQEAMGYECVDAGEVSGTMGGDIGAFFLRKLHKDHPWPIAERVMTYSAEDLFDVIELLFDYVSKPVDGRYHDWSNCGWHYATFDQDAGQADFRREMNEFLRDFRDGFELSKDGEVVRRAAEGLRPLEEAGLPASSDRKNVNDRVRAAVEKYRKRSATRGQRRDAVRDLADVLEFLRPQLHGVISRRDEADLFNIANNFGIRHHNQLQKNDYDPEWLSFLFYLYLSMIHVATRLLEKRKSK